MLAMIRKDLRSNVVGYVALFVAHATCLQS